MTPLRSLNVHSVASALGVQLSASTGLIWSVLGSVIARNSPTCPSMQRPPWSPTVTGLIAPVGTTMAAFSVPPGLIAPVEPPDAGVELPPVLLAPPHALRMTPSRGIDIPITVPRRRNSRRETLPARSSSIRWFSSSLR